MIQEISLGKRIQTSNGTTRWGECNVPEARRRNGEKGILKSMKMKWCAGDAAAKSGDWGPETLLHLQDWKSLTA